MFHTLQLHLEKFSYRSSRSFQLQSIQWNLKQGEFWLLCGANGSGKTTFLKILCGLLSFSQGRVLLNDKDKNEYSREDYFHFFGMVFQKNALFDNLSVQSQLEFVLQQAKFSSNKIEFYLKSVGLWEAKDKFPVELSGGMKKRLAIIRSLILAPPILLCDDPTAGLDPVTSAELMEFLVSECRENKTTLVVSSQPRLAYKKWFSSVLLLERGTARTFDITQLESEFPHL